MSGTRAHTDAEKARAVGLALVNGTKAAAAAAGVTDRTVRRWIDDPAMSALVNENKETVRGHLWAGMQVALDSVVEGLKQPEAPLQARSTTLGILFDKWALMSGEATNRTETRAWTDALDPDNQRKLRDWALDKLDELDERGRSDGTDQGAEGSGLREPATGDVH